GRPGRAVLTADIVLTMGDAGQRCIQKSNTHSPFPRGSQETVEVVQAEWQNDEIRLRTRRMPGAAPVQTQAMVALFILKQDACGLDRHDIVFDDKRRQRSASGARS